MEGKRLRVITVILAILLICLVSFIGVYVQNTNKMENKVKGYELSKSLSGYRELVFEVSSATEVLDSEGNIVGDTDSYSDSTITENSYQKTENPINSDESKTEENYNKSKEIIEKRLNSLNVEDYNLSLDKETGKIYLQLPEDTDTDHTVSNILQVANFELKDSEDTTNVFLTNEDLKNVSAVYNTTTTGTTVYLQIELNKTGKEILKKISSGEYATKQEDETDEEDEEVAEEDSTEETEDENAVEAEVNVSTSEEVQEDSSEEESEDSGEETEETTDEEESTQKEVTLSIDDSDLLTTSFDDPIENGIITLSMSQATTDVDSISDSLQSTSTISLLLNSGEMPLTYTVSSNQYVKVNISENTINLIAIITGIIALIALIYMIVKFKIRGLIASIAYVGFIAIYLLVIRYTNVNISIESIVALYLVALLNFGLTKRLTAIHEADKEIRKRVHLREFKNTIIKLIPIFMVSIVFSFVKWVPISTFGMVMFWGIALSIIYNYLLTKNIL